MPPTGRMKKPTPKVAVVSSSEAYWLSEGKNNREMTSARKPKIMKSYHSSAFPITAAAIWRIFGADWLAGIAVSHGGQEIMLHFRILQFSHTTRSLPPQCTGELYFAFR